MSEARHPSPTPYRGRFAPSPTGSLHFGSLVAAVGSYLQARVQGGRWLVRMEDVDIVRAVDGADREILDALRAFGMHWDGPVMYQSEREAAYRQALEHLQQWTYPCACTRKEIGGPVYPGTCRRGLAPGRQPRATRVRVPESTVVVHDALQGPFRQSLHAQVGDFVVHRADGMFAYQLAVVVDDAEQGITEVVRGSDLLDSTPRQMHLQHLLGARTPAYVHLPVALDESGSKLSKHDRSAPVDPADPVPVLWQTLAFLGQAPPLELREAYLAQLWEWAIERWSLRRVPARPALPAPRYGA